MINTKEALLEFISDSASLNVIIKEEDNLVEDLGMDELDIIELVLRLEEEFEVEILDENAEKFITAKDIIDFLQSKNITLN